MAEAERQQREKEAAELKLRVDVMSAIKERKMEGMITKFFSPEDRYYNKANKTLAYEKDENRRWVALQWAADSNCGPAAVKVILEANEDAVHLVTPEKEGAKNILHLAAEKAQLVGKTEKEVAKLIDDKRGLLAYLVSAKPEMAKERNGDGMLALHLAARALGSKAPEEAVTCLLEAHREAAKEEAGDGSGDLPLHIASKSEHSVGVYTALLGANPEATRVTNAAGNLPLHYVAGQGAAATAEVTNLLIRTSKKALEARDEHGRLPLHIAVEMGCSDEVVSAIISAFPKAARMEGPSDHLPVRIAFDKTASDAVMAQLLETYPEGAEVKDDQGKLLLHRAAETNASDRVVEALLTAYPMGAQARDGIIITYNRSRKPASSRSIPASRGYLPLHYAAEHRASAEVVRQLLQAHPEGVRVKDYGGQLPLHCAALHQALDEVVTQLVAAYPDAAREAVLPGGRLPLHFAADSQATEGGVSAIVRAFPEGAMQKDEDGTLALHLAAPKQAYLELCANTRLTEQKAAALYAAKFEDLSNVSSDKKVAMVKMKAEADEALAAAIKAHTAAVAAADVNQRMLRAVLEATFVVDDAGPEGGGAADEHDLFSSSPGGGLVPRGVLSEKLQGAKLPVDDFEEMLTSDPKPAKEVDRFGSLPLHRALLKGAPHRAVRALVNAFPQGVKERDGGGQLPLHIGVENGASHATVAMLLEAYPQAAREKDQHYRLPLHYAAEKGASDAVVSALLISHFEAAKDPVLHSRMYPLHYASENTPSDYTISALLMAYPEAAAEKDTDHCLPLHRALLNRASDFTVGVLGEAYPEAAAERDVWGNLPLHYAAAAPAYTSVIPALIEAHSEGAKVKDNDGNLPLHVALIAGAPDTTVSALVEAFPHAVRAPTKAGKSPVTLAKLNATNLVVSELTRGEILARDIDGGPILKCIRNCCRALGSGCTPSENAAERWQA